MALQEDLPCSSVDISLVAPDKYFRSATASWWMGNGKIFPEVSSSRVWLALPHKASLSLEGSGEGEGKGSGEGELTALAQAMHNKGAAKLPPVSAEELMPRRELQP